MKKLLLLILLFISCNAFAQEEQTERQQMIAAIDSMIQVKRDSLAIIESSLKEQPVQTIGGIPFGISRTEALLKLRNKYGEPEYNPKSTVLSFKNVTYAGRDFNTVHFLFESDGINSYLNACIFVKDAKTRDDAVSIMEGLKKDLEKRYDVGSAEAENGFTTYGGGVSPIWDGNIVNFKDEYITAWHTDVIEYSKELVKLYGNKYGVRLIYGPYSYIKEEF